MRASVEDPSFVQAVRKKYRALIVDEFQDTDPIQWQIFETLFMREKEGLAALYLVGDPNRRSTHFEAQTSIPTFTRKRF